MQNLGGIGFTWEHPAHLLLKRAHLLDIVLGPRRRAYVDVLSPERHLFA
jgi:alkylation response protein AidB-like acyl-CoA dehydrogenase